MSEKVNYNYLEDLNKAQREAVEYIDGPSLIVAGAGSGKTRVLTYKIVHLIRMGMEPYRIMALTFTNKASREMRDRIRGMVGEKISSKLIMGTFHSVFLSILRRNADKIGYKSGFSIYDTADSKNLVKMIIKDLALDEKVYKPSTILGVISNAKNKLQSCEDYLSDTNKMKLDKHLNRPLTGKIFQLYEERRILANAMDFDDILVNMYILLRDNPDLRRHYQEFFKFILVDEYQDTNFAQHRIIKMLIGDDKKFMAVGDDSQSIYSFRGAEVLNILNLQKDLPELQIFKLEQNYRSTQNIVDAASSLIEKNTHKINKNVFSENRKGEKIEVISSFSDLEEAFLVANKINQSKLNHHDSYEDYAILYRTNAQSRALEESLRKRNIPYRIFGGLSFYQRKEVKDAISYFRLAVNPDDDEALRRIINTPVRGIGETTMKKLSSAAIKDSKSLWAVISDSNLKEAGLNSGTIKKLYAFKNLIDEFIEDNEKGVNAYELGQLIYNRTGLLSQFAYDSTPETISRHENLMELISYLKNFVEIKEQTGEAGTNMQAFLSEVMLATDQDEKDSEDIPKVTMMTVHAAKGLEYKHIYIVGLEEDLFPSIMAQNSLNEIEEERRLLYVAITRAMESCTITYAKSRFRNGQTVLASPSRFLQDINPKFLNSNMSSELKGGYSTGMKSESSYNPYGKVDPFNNYKTSIGRTIYNSGNNKTETSSLKRTLRKITDVGLSKVTPQHTSSELKISDMISHSKFGIGEIISIDSISGEPSITVKFKEVGIKRLLLRFAKFDILNK